MRRYVGSVKFGVRGHGESGRASIRKTLPLRVILAVIVS